MNSIKKLKLQQVLFYIKENKLCKASMYAEEKLHKFVINQLSAKRRSQTHSAPFLAKRQ